MRAITLGLLVIAATASVSCSSTSDTGSLSGKQIELFNGRDLEGWSYHLVDLDVKMQDVWSVRDGLRICRGEPLGYLHTAGSYKNFKLVVEWRWAPGKKPGNSGVLMRINGEPRGIPRSIEAQLGSGSAGDFYGFHGMQIDGAPERRVTASGEAVGELVGVKRMETLENPPGQWNRYDITIDGPYLIASINGKKANEAWGCDVLKGPIGRQSEGGEIHFRRVALTPIQDEG